MRAIALVSGGLDSILAARVIKEQGVDILPVHFEIPFCHRKKQTAPDKGVHALVNRGLAEELRVVDINVDFLELVLRPKHGFGSNMNPCIDCKIFMLKKAKALMKAWDAQFVVTGEVLGQRPMSQHRRALEIIEKESGLEGLLLRPLCAGILPETLPEKSLWVNRSKLFNFSGRSRRPQMELARELGIDKYPNPAGGCLLTDTQFSCRLRDLINHQALNMGNVRLLKLGRHFRLDAHSKLIVGRNEQENEELEAEAYAGDYLFMPDKTLAGPTCLGKGIFDRELMQISSQIAGRYCDSNGAKSVKIICYNKGDGQIITSEGDSGGYPCSFEVIPMGEDKLKALRL